MPVNVEAMDADFYVFSGHKMFAPTGIGALYAKPEVLEDMPPWQGGGNMISDVTFERTSYEKLPGEFEAGTGNIADAVGLGAALDYVNGLGLPNIAGYEHDLLDTPPADMHRAGPAAGWHGPGEGQRPDIRAGGLLPHEVGSASTTGDRGAGRPPLRPADPAPVRPGSRGQAIAGDV